MLSLLSLLFDGFPCEHLPKRLKLTIGQIVGQSQELSLGDRVGQELVEEF
jgi:hypothetical protein